MPNAYQPPMPNASFDPNLSHSTNNGLVRPDTAEREFSPGESSEDDEDVAMAGTSGNGSGFETHPMVDRTSRWERQGREFGSLVFLRRVPFEAVLIYP